MRRVYGRHECSALCRLVRDLNRSKNRACQGMISATTRRITAGDPLPSHAHANFSCRATGHESGTTWSFPGASSLSIETASGQAYAILPPVPVEPEAPRNPAKPGRRQDEYALGDCQGNPVTHSCPTMYLAWRMARATMVCVGFSAVLVGNRLPSLTNRLAISCVWPWELVTPSAAQTLIRQVPML